MAREIVKKVKNAVLYSDGCIRIDNVRASYPHLDKAWAKNESDRPKFSITGLAPKETHEEAKKLLVEEINKLLTSSKIGKLASEHKFVRNGDDSGKEEAEGHWIIKASENPDRRPSCRTPRGTVMTPDEIAEKIYPRLLGEYPCAPLGPEQPTRQENQRQSDRGPVRSRR
ncbi:DUF2815 family protein [Pseudomonas aeruginosa]|uniref:DUF2815 family protein n=1 Tax=Pseudomonas aeruginosa TaxID=287 RepID=UPI0021F19A91|nr:DUF2815 family protein [Pseudomonas aeruginosa]UYM64362.1 DUF2815 family protein [Pseudomonas aeruginosa]